MCLKKKNKQPPRLQNFPSASCDPTHRRTVGTAANCTLTALSFCTSLSEGKAGEGPNRDMLLMLCTDNKQSVVLKKFSLFKKSSEGVFFLLHRVDPASLSIQ